MDEINNLVWITDRTLDDVRFIAQDTLDTGKMQAHKGALNYQDLNRIYSNIKVLLKHLENIGNYIVMEDTVKTTWVVTDLPYLEDIDDLRNLMKTIKDLLNLQTNQIRYWETLNYEDMNILESVGKLCGQMIINIYTQVLYTNDVICGGEY